MLRLENIIKDYKVADTYVHALKGINLAFRENEFVSILGPSGCGKTTMLNIIGGLDKYTSGDLFINGKSTKDFKDRDWDIYRNHRIGFIFQSYNLIPHQTILGNVELALTIAGLTKEERIERAKKAIDRVGLEGQYNKHPNQLSGGQCQRVAIARALVNEPEILLADEPTGALDTQTSIQIMELIKEISQEKLVIMVTHNPDLAKQYSTRIVRLLDGELVTDSNPYTLEEEKKETEIEEENSVQKKEKAKMSFWTAFKLSLRNLFTKKARTALICVAGSIGIIGVSSVLAVSSGVQGYITSMQDDMLSGNPVQISESAYDLSAMMTSMSPMDKINSLDIVDGKINVNEVIKRLITQGQAMEKMQISNNITQDYIDYVYSIDEGYAAAISLEYGIDVTNNIYTDYQVHYNKPEEKKNTSLSAIKNIYTSVLGETEFSRYASYVTGLTNVFQQAPNDKDYILSQYNFLYGDEIATKENEIMIVVNSDQELTDLLLAQLGYYTQDQFINTTFRHLNDPSYNPEIDKNRFDFSELIGKKFYYYPNDMIYEKQAETPFSGPFKYHHEMDKAVGQELVVKAILKPKASISYGCMTSGFFYTEAFAKKFIQDGLKSEVVKYLIDNDLAYYGMYTKENGQFDNKAITYAYNYTPSGEQTPKTAIGYVGSANAMSELLSMMMGGSEGGSSSSMTAMYTTLSLRQLGGTDIANDISIYPINFDLKDGVTKHLDAWNSDETLTFKNSKGEMVTLKAEEREQITYTDNIAVLINMINSLINLITTALIAFTALSLVVSCFMIAIITYVSVVERVKEIGVIRSLGGRKKDVTHLFNAETFIIGLISGVFGIIVTYIISLILNIIVDNLTGVTPIAALPLWQAAVMILVSILLTVISGVIPARSAAKKDPVVALRTE
ncbi:MAG: ABC transporter ATP-binding protein/permease [Anaeroplasmataceae bacterium]|nr:ABC transporter ATP-binding protein/permease [Anaeroplasmataceae bacterium]MDE6414278.1 ABC transporter ATP-binding protein/permease [Anaeroplasmataceae bacterium]